ncbi:MAG: hypothetical protein NC223_02365 [Butyrivibrio sp.]|nr:hypothetical protein [Butyrivibrio sp.]
MEKTMNAVIIVLMAVLLASQIFLAVRQIKKNAPDGKILLIIDIAVFVVWTPLCVLQFIYDSLAVRAAWFVIAVLYMVFTLWYTNNLSKGFKK